MASKKNRIIGLVLAAVLVITAIPVSTYLAKGTENNQNTEKEENVSLPPKPTNTNEAVKAPIEEVTMADYKLVAESKTYKLYYYEPRLSIILENKETGAIMESTMNEKYADESIGKQWQGYIRSGVVLTALVGTKNVNQVDLVNDEHLIETTYTDNGFSTKIYFTKYEFGLTVEVSLEDDALVVNVPDESIVEYSTSNYIGCVTLFPLFGYSYLGEVEGYMLIPDGNGALISLDDKEGKYGSGFMQMIYGGDVGFREVVTQTLLWDKYETVVDENYVIAPVFGMAHTEEQMAYLAVVESGEKRAYIEAAPNGVTVAFNRCFARFELRKQYNQPMNLSGSAPVGMVEADRIHADLTVRYLLLDGENANYSGMAVAYRNYLLENGMTAKDTSYNTRVDILGVEQEEFLMGTTDVTMTSVSQLRKIYEELKAAGVESLLTVYKGWQDGGLYSVPINSYKPDGSIGSTKELTQLIQDSEEQGYMLYLYNDALRINGRTNLTTFDALKMVNKTTMKEEVNKQVYDMFYYLLPSKLQQKLQKMTDSYTKKGVNNLAVCGISNTLFSYSSRGKYYDRNDTAETFQSLLASVDETTDLILEQPFAYLWNYTDAFLDMPLDSSQYMYITEEVPFLSMVLKGILPMYTDYVNFEADKTEFFLKMVESGVYPSFYLTYENSSDLIYTNSSNLFSTQYEIYKDTVTEYDAALRQVAKQVEGACIMKHETLTNDVVKVTYDNGAVIYVNYSEDTIVVDNVTVNALSYEVVK